MNENPFKWLLILIAALSLLQVGAYAFRPRREIPGLLLQLGWAAAAIWALNTNPERARVVSPWVIVASLLVTELQSLLCGLVGRARVGGRYVLLMSIIWPSAIGAETPDVPGAPRAVGGPDAGATELYRGAA